jgi:hypothetical protein
MYVIHGLLPLVRYEIKASEECQCEKSKNLLMSFFLDGMGVMTFKGPA